VEEAHAMPSSVNGFGTKLLGERDFCRNGSYVTTKWVSIFWIPVLPLESLRIRETEGFDIGVLADLQYTVLEQLPNLHLKQVLSVYLFVAAFIAWIVLGGWLSLNIQYFSTGLVPLLWILGLPAIGSIPFVLRYRAKKKIRGIQPTSATTGL
jgi:hypothetical protein